MLITLRNELISLTVDTKGAQMMSIQSSDHCEYLWQGNPKYWADRAPTLFPFIGRLTNNRYAFHGNIFEMGIHGFAAESEFSPVDQCEDALTLRLCSSRATREKYPFDFSLQVTYRLDENCIQISYSVQNLGHETMPFGIGGHPGFRVPLEEGEEFEDYAIEFLDSCCPDRVGFTPAVFLSGHDTPYPLADGRFIPLRHDLFDDDAIILKNMARRVRLSAGGSRSVTVLYPDMGYLGIWHRPKSDAPYVCIEPWTSLPARQDIVEELSCKSDLVHLAPGKTYTNHWFIAIT
ncbi:MAG: aldose 1-epimerase family protein [Faecousia sp.]